MGVLTPGHAHTTRYLLGFNPCFYWMGVLTWHRCQLAIIDFWFQSLFLLDGRFDSGKTQQILDLKTSFNPCFYWMGVLTRFIDSCCCSNFCWFQSLFLLDGRFDSGFKIREYGGIFWFQSLFLLDGRFDVLHERLALHLLSVSILVFIGWAF